MTAPFAPQLRALAEAWREALRIPKRRLALAGVALALVVALLVARRGTGPARLLAGATLALAMAAVLASRVVERRVFGDPARTIRRIAGKVDPERAARALRALSLVGEGTSPRDPGTSAALARLHVERALAALPRDRIAEGAAQRALRLGVLSFVLLAVAVAVGGANLWAMLEGADVLVARGGVAPVTLRWLDDVEIRARPPEYLHLGERAVGAGGADALPRGTLLTVRGAPRRPGRRLALSDGTTEVPMVDDGSGRMVARWPLGDTVALRVVARFGDVVVEEPEATAVTSIPDEAPEVVLEGAPKQIALVTAEDGGDVPIRYEATDDHGLREVHLVLRAGVREERRVLARLDGSARIDRGGYILRARDPFVRKAHAPVEVRVEAKDNDPVTGPKWGASLPITILPPDVGEPEALRLDALRALRDAFVDALAARMKNDPLPAEAAARRAAVAAQGRGVDEDASRLEGALQTSFAGVRVSARLGALLLGQMRLVREAQAALAKAPSAERQQALVRATERLVLVADGVVRGLGERDTREASRQLAVVADDLALGATQALRPGEKERGAARMDGAVTVLGGGGRAMLRLGALGRDIGEIVAMDLRRVSRARGAGDLVHAELAARDLAARLREPDPSFGARGRSSRGGGESGGGRGTPGDDETEPDEAEHAFNEAARDLEQLATDHNEGIGKVEQAMSGAPSDEDAQRLLEEGKRHAQAVREAARGLPSIGAGSDSWTSKGAAAREHAEAMARSLEQGNPADAVASGRSAISALEEAKRIAGRERWMGAGGGLETDAERRITDARQKLEPELRWAEQRLEGLRKRAAQRAAPELAARGQEEEQMAERARELGQRGREDGALPAPALDALDGAERSAREAARALRRGDADKGLEQQREAQRLLDSAREAMGQAEGDRGGGDGDAPQANDHADIPKADAHKGPEEFRRRVMQGLGQPGKGRLKDAVRRYAEGLLR